MLFNLEWFDSKQAAIEGWARTHDGEQPDPEWPIYSKEVHGKNWYKVNNRFIPSFDQLGYKYCGIVKDADKQPWTSQSKSVKLYKLKPLVMESIQFTDEEGNIEEIKEFLNLDELEILTVNCQRFIRIDSDELWDEVDVGDWITKSPTGEFIINNDTNFKMLFEEI